MMIFSFKDLKNYTTFHPHSPRFLLIIQYEGGRGGGVGGSSLNSIVQDSKYISTYQLSKRAMPRNHAYINFQRSCATENHDPLMER